MSNSSCLSSAGSVLLLVALLHVGAVPAAGQVRRLGTFVPPVQAEAIRHTDALNPTGIIPLDENYKFTSGASNAAFGRNRAYVVDGQFLLEFKRNDLVTGPLRLYNSGATLLDVEPASREGEVALLTRTAFHILDLTSGSSPRILSTVSISNTQPTWGKLLARFGDTFYVVDNSIRGFKALDAHNSPGPVVVTQYTSRAKVVGNPGKFTVTDLRRDGSVLSLVIGGTLEVISVDNLLRPNTLTSLGTARFQGVTLGLPRGSYEYLVNGSTVQIVKILPGTPGFLTEVLRFTTSATITDLFAHQGRLYLLCGKQGYEVWDIANYEPL